MIKHIIFDVGGVLMQFDTHALTEHYAGNKEDGQLLHEEIFDHPDWISVDRHLPEDVALQSMKTRIPQRLWPAAGQVMAHWDEWLRPDQAINALAQEAAQAGYDIYILSNTSERFYRFRENMPAWSFVKGCILSFEERLMKPDPEIYRRLYARFNLAPSECFFVDDSHLNIEAAQWSGMKGCLYRGRIAEVRAALRSLGVQVTP